MEKKIQIKHLASGEIRWKTPEEWAKIQDNGFGAEFKVVESAVAPAEVAAKLKKGKADEQADAATSEESTDIS